LAVRKIRPIILEVETAPIATTDWRWKAFCRALFAAMEADGLLPVIAMEDNRQEEGPQQGRDDLAACFQG
jgi:hypothetical protein